MEEFKENKSAIITIVCFALIILGIVGYFVYDMLIKSKKVDKSFDITLTEVSLKVNEVKDIKNYITLENIELNEIIFTSSDKDIAYIEDATIVAPSKEGIAIITATYKKIVKKITIKVGDVKVSTGTDTKEPITATDPTNQYGIELYPKTKKITLDGENVSVKLGNDLELSFIGKLSEENHNEPIYQYNLNINKNGNLVNTDILGNNYNIYSSNYTSIFEVFEFNNNYIFKSYVGKQCKGSYVVIYDKSLNLLKSFNDVDIKFDSNTNSIEVDEYDSCMPDCTTQSNMNNIRSTKTKYKYNGTSLEEVEKITKTYADICNH